MNHSANPSSLGTVQGPPSSTLPSSSASGDVIPKKDPSRPQWRWCIRKLPCNATEVVVNQSLILDTWKVLEVLPDLQVALTE